MHIRYLNFFIHITKISLVSLQGLTCADSLQSLTFDNFIITKYIFDYLTIGLHVVNRLDMSYCQSQNNNKILY